MLKVFSIVEKEWTGKRERERHHAQDETIGISISASSVCLSDDCGESSQSEGPTTTTAVV